MGCVLTVAAGLLITSFSNLLHAKEGFNPDHLTTMFFETPDSGYKDSRPQFYREYFEKLRALPGVQAAAGAMVLPMSDNGIAISFENPERPVPEGERPNADLSPITPGYFSAMQVPVIEGRDFIGHDDAKREPVMIVNRAFADKFFPNETVLGKKLKPGAGTPHGTPWREIVGVVGDIRLKQRNETCVRRCICLSASSAIRAACTPSFEVPLISRVWRRAFSGFSHIWIRTFP